MLDNNYRGKSNGGRNIFNHLAKSTHHSSRPIFFIQYSQRFGDITVFNGSCKLNDVRPAAPTLKNQLAKLLLPDYWLNP